MFWRLNWGKIKVKFMRVLSYTISNAPNYLYSWFKTIDIDRTYEIQGVFFLFEKNIYRN